MSLELPLGGAKNSVESYGEMTTVLNLVNSHTELQHATVGSSTRSVEKVLYHKCQQGVTKCLACRYFSSLTVWVNLSKGSEKLFQLLQRGASTFFLWEMLHVSFIGFSHGGSGKVLTP